MATSGLTRVKLIAGRSNPELSELISSKLGIPLTKVKISDFGNTEIGVEINESIRGFHVFIIQTGGSYQGRSINDHLQELYGLIQACKLSSAKSVNLIMPCYAYARSDKKDKPRTPINASCQALIYQSLGIDRIVSMDLHAGQIQGMLPTIPFDNLYGKKLHIDNLKNTVFKGLTDDQIKNQFVLAAPDVGAAKMIESYAKLLGIKHVLMHKHRNYDVASTVLNTVLIGEDNAVLDKTVIIIDDIFDSFGTINSATDELVKHGAKSVMAIATHGIFSGQAFDKINNNKYIERVIVTNTLPQLENAKKSAKLQIVDTSDLFVEVIKRLRTGTGGISELFM
ncbi:ribose-phosphate pyrophosphokinase [Fadolivirus algeromassiliense]|jgi:ribose-phosphate pyrophosphokinase|uniref:ribose-phosphate diphosphokinase n=1 Tax=Fadolivirus FV1/VV64 TaxID=3070911 RepID=A0A7D3R2K2_9VIRU|nr:ribose-phosphate pyrophosphokinase [Fadolivirus algeromassiliense]QKF94578.1 ribose-phosphate pyrophosphokinase [Fadolivirus FV1/VV64]